MAAFDASESLTPFKIGQGARANAYGAILCDAADVRQVEADWFTPGFWGDKAKQVTSGGRGGAWYLETPLGPAVLRQYLRGGWAARISRDRYFWRGADRVRSFAEFRLTRKLHAKGLPVPRPIAASYRRRGLGYRTAILLQRLEGVQTLAELVVEDAAHAPWEQAGELVARFHRAGLDHADLNAHNILFDVDGQGVNGQGGGGEGWLIDFDKGRLRILATDWRERNLARLRRSLLKVRGTHDADPAGKDFERLRGAYDAAWKRGY